MKGLGIYISVLFLNSCNIKGTQSWNQYTSLSGISAMNLIK